MALEETTFAGTIQSDGTLVFDEPTNLPPGRVVVSVRKPSPPTGFDWWTIIRQGRRTLEGMGYPTMSESEVRSHIEWLRGDDDRIENIYREMEEHRRRSSPQ